MGKLVGTILRFVFSWIDAILVKLITTIYKLFSNLSELVLYSDNIIKLIGKRIGLILGIFMLFKLAISLINYMISPDKISDKSKGGGRLIINVGVSLALLISVNFIFKEAYMIQGVIVNSKIIEKIFFGNNGIINKDNSLETKMDIGYYLYSGFITPNVEVFGHSCDEMWDVSINLQELTDTQKANDDTNVCDDLLIDKLSDNAYKSVYKARNTMDMSYVFYDHELLLESPSERVFAFDYTPIISTAAGVIVLLVLLSFSMDLATRAVKLLFLQIIAPIPIISNMDMGKGQDIFKKWGKECINTYLSVFIRLIAINFAVFMIVLLRGNYKNLFINNVWLNIFLIIGCLMFAKQVPGLIEEFLGIKLNGMALHPLKKFQEQALFGKQITGVAGGLVAGTGAGLAAGVSNVFAPGAGGRILGAGAGFTSAFSRGVMSGAKGEKINKAFTSAYTTAMTNKQSRKDRKDDDVDWHEMIGARIGQSIGLHTKADVIKTANDSIKKVQDAYKTMHSQAAAMDTTNFTASTYGGTYNGQNAEIRQFSSMSFDGIKELAKFKEQAESTKLQQKVGESDAHFIQRQKDHQDYLKYIDDTINGRVNALADGVRTRATTGDAATDKAIQDAFETMNVAAKSFNSVVDSIDSGIGHITGADAKTINGTSKGAEARLSVSSAVRHIQDVQQYATKKDQK